MRIALENKETDNNVDLLSEKETIKPKHIIGERSSDAISEGQILNKTFGKPNEVKFGCNVRVLLNNKSYIDYNIPKDEKTGEWFTVQKKINWKKVDEEFDVGKYHYKVIEINW